MFKRKFSKKVSAFVDTLSAVFNVCTRTFMSNVIYLLGFIAMNAEGF